MRDSVKYLLAACVVGVLGNSQLSSAQSVTGYAKELVVASRSVITDDAYQLSISRFRLQGSVNAGSAWNFQAWGDAEWRTGSFLESIDYRLASPTSVDPLVALTTRRSFGSRSEGLLRLYRLTATREGRRLRIVAGRQRIPWGTTLVWNPTDLFNPTAPASLERDERAAIDAIRMSLAMGVLSAVDVVAAPASALSEGRYAIRYRGHRGETDLSGMAGWFDGRWVAGADMAGYVRSAGVRAEGTVDDAGRFRLAANTDYTLRDGTYLTLEGYYNGGGDLSFQRDRWYGAVMASRSVHPLIGVSLYGIHNMEDGSGLVGPGIQASVTMRLDAALSAYVPYGTASSEFGVAHPLLFASLQYWF